MISSIHRQWLNQRILIADQIVNSFGHAAEADASILLCCALSALAATIWPGDKIDQKRFIELLCKFTPSSRYVKQISICALIQQLEDKSSQEFADKLINHFFHSSLYYHSKSLPEYGYEGSGLYVGTLSKIIDPDDIDVGEEKIYQITPEICSKDVRRASYASIIYSDLRCGLVHNYEVGENVAASGWHHNSGCLNYINFIIMPDESEVKTIGQRYGVALDEARDALTKVRRRLYFPYTYMQNLVIETANSVFNFWDTADKFDHPKPTHWWIDG